MTYKIGLIGAGQIGSRHLQALAKSNLKISVYVIDPSVRSLEIAKDRFNEIQSGNKLVSVNYGKTIKELPKDIDIAIVTTNSDIRYSVVKSLILEKSVKNLILEKVLFQKIEDYYNMDEILQEKEIKCRVNHPRRMFPFYQELKKMVEDSKQINFSVQGGGWGLACNGLHFIDVFSYLSGETDLSINTGHLFNKIYKSKRDNFIEFNGKLTGTIGNNLFTLYSGEDTTPVVITITSGTMIAFIDEANGYFRYATKENNWQWQEKNEKIIYYQSELSNIIIENILLHNKCLLPDYHEAMQLHIPFLKGFIDFMEKIDKKKHNSCPIT